MKKSTLNFAINILMFVCMSAIAGIGFLIKFTLIPGQERWIKYDRNVELYLFGMERHEWGTIHLVIGFVLLGLLILHIILHWKAITCVYNRFIQNAGVKKIIASVFIVICSLLIIFSFFINPQIEEIEQDNGRQERSYKNSNKRESKNKTLTSYEKENLNDVNHNHSNQSIEIRGYMTIDEVSKNNKVPAEYIKIELNIPKSISDKQRLSVLRKKYDFKMSDVEKIIYEYKKNE